LPKFGVKQVTALSSRPQVERAAQRMTAPRHCLGTSLFRTTCATHLT
jgi:hypothetical protein